jgi:hypothetical protein
VPVYFNPQRPDEAVLIRGLEGSDLFLALFLTPFTVIMLALWYGVAASFRKPKAGFRGMVIREHGDRTWIRPPRTLALIVPAGVLALSAFLSIFPIALLFGGSHPTMVAVSTAWGIVLALTAASAILAQGIAAGPRFRIVLDDGRKVVRLRNQEEIAYAAIQRLSVERHLAGYSKERLPGAKVYLEYTRGNQPALLLVRKWASNLEEANRFAAWMAARMNVPVKLNPESAEAPTMPEVWEPG